MIQRYNFQFPNNTKDATIELAALAYGPTEDRFQHIQSAIDLLWNKRFKDSYMWNDWTELMMRKFCENNYTAVTGSAASWKTTTAGLYALCKWFSSPADTAVILTSTTLDGLRRRIWKEVTRYYRMEPAMGNLIQSRNCIQFTKGSDDAGIFGIAVDKGDIDKAIGKIIGFHARNILVVVDEMQYTSEAIVEACVNLEAGAETFQFVGLGNADDQLDPHGRMCEPENGWDSITPERDTWKTKRGVCIHLDALDSPNVKAGKDLYPGLVRQRDIDNTIRDYGADSPQFWQMRRGFWPPEGISRTVLSAPMIAKFKARDKAVWVDNFVMGAALDPAFEGSDRCILRFGKCGLIDVGQKEEHIEPFQGEKNTSLMALSLGEIIQIKVQLSIPEPIHYQIVRIVREACLERGVGPQMFALDSTGEGGGLASIFHREWSPEIMCIEFGGRPSRKPVSNTNPKRADEEYYLRVTELWYQFRLLVQNGQIRDLDNETAAELCQRKIRMRGPLIQVEPKAEMKERTKKSPDLADATVCLSELFLSKLSSFKFLPQDTFTPDNRWKEFARKLDATPEDEELYATSALD